MSAPKRHRDDDARRKKARARFRMLIRSVMFNRIWLMDTGEQKMSLNVKKNISMFVRPKRKIGMLTMAEKTIIRTDPSLRSLEDRKKLVNLLATLSCFSRYPPKVRARLASVIQFILVGPNRTIIREGDPPRCMYFIISGEVDMSRRQYDHIRGIWVDKVEVVAGPGDVVGDTELLEGINRMSSVTSITEVEMLFVFSEDYNLILKSVCTADWVAKRKALMSLEYFQFFSPDQFIIGCKLGILKQFEPLETIYYEDKGVSSYVHFVISGECVILQCLKTKVTNKKDGKNFELMDISKEAGDLNEFSSQETLQYTMGVKADLDAEIEAILGADEEFIEEGNKKEMSQKAAIKNVEIACGLRPTSSFITSERSGDYEMNLEEENEHEQESKMETSLQYEQHDSLEEVEGESFKTSTEYLRSKSSKDELHQTKSSLKSHSFTDGLTSSNTQFPKTDNTKIESHFIDVGSLTYGGIFGLGEQLEHRVIMARTVVQCLMLPRYWLLEKEQNPGNIWQRRRFYLDATIPTRKGLFKDFVTTQKWQKFKQDLIEQSVPSQLGNSTKVQDIPIYCRIVEAMD